MFQISHDAKAMEVVGWRAFEFAVNGQKFVVNVGYDMIWIMCEDLFLAGDFTHPSQSLSLWDTYTWKGYGRVMST